MRLFQPASRLRCFHHAQGYNGRPAKWSSMALARNHSSSAERVKATPWAKSVPESSGVSSYVSKGQLRAQKRAFIALGSNLGDRIELIEKACNAMSARGIRVMRTSSLWETEPMYVLDQGDFVNGVCEVETSLKPIALLDALQEVENSLGREKIIDKGPRNIDLDILLYEDVVLDHDRLKLPHPLITEREFVLRPLAELIPEQPLYPSQPWKFTQDYLNALPPPPLPLSTLTPLSRSVSPLHALKINRPTQVMAILNVTPDSFSDGGIHTGGALANAILSFIESGATFIDVGGQSSAPGAPNVSAEEEISRVLPAIEQIRNNPQSKNVVVSIDTYRSSVAKAAIEAGADMVNDISAGLLDSEMLPTVAKLGTTICLMHMRGNPSTMNKLTDYEPAGLIPTIATELLDRVSAAQDAGIRRWRIVLDPGIGFAKTAAQNIEILRRMDELRDWPGLRGLPWLLGSSRKNFIGKVTGVTEPRDRVWGTAATVAAAVQGGADIVRVHDMPEMTQVVKMADAIWRNRLDF